MPHHLHHQKYQLRTHSQKTITYESVTCAFKRMCTCSRPHQSIVMPLWHKSRADIYQILPLFSLKHWKTGSGLQTRIYCKLSAADTVTILRNPSAWPYIQASVQKHLWVSLLECNLNYFPNHCGWPHVHMHSCRGGNYTQLATISSPFPYNHPCKNILYMLANHQYNIIWASSSVTILMRY